MNEGEAKSLYIKNRKVINSFNDFYEFLLVHFHTNKANSSEESIMSFKENTIDFYDTSNSTRKPCI
jgi:hypothetical protein